ncbi:MAG: hypothetical protein ABFD44_05480 [Anaerolineaceae bacterium]
MHTAYQYPTYLLHKQVFSFTGRFRIYNPEGQMVLFCQQKIFKLREDLRVYADEAMTQPMLAIQARQIMDFSAAYDVSDALTGEKVGALRRRGWKSIARDEWEVLDAYDRPVGVLIEDSLGHAMLRRLLLGSLFPQNYDLLVNDRRVMDLRQRFHMFRYVLELDFRENSNHEVDPRLGIAAGILLAAIEGKQGD